MVTEQASNGTRVKSAATRLPGLDGVRALAVIAVIAFHEQLTVLPGGFLGVDVFFVLSGYLITDLLVAQWHQHGRLRLGSFWARRARRLLPALATMLVVVTAATAIIEPSQLAALRPALLAAVAIIGPNRELVLVNTYEARSWEAADNRLIDTAATGTPTCSWPTGSPPSSTAPACSGRTRCTRSHPAPGSTPTRSPPRSETRLSASVAVTPTGPPLAHHLRPAS